MAKKKLPTDYPQFTFRISKEDKKKLNDLTTEILKKSNATLKEDEKVFRKNDILVDALYLGLLTLKKKGNLLTRN